MDELPGASPPPGAAQIAVFITFSVILTLWTRAELAHRAIAAERAASERGASPSASSPDGKKTGGDGAGRCRGATARSRSGTWSSVPSIRRTRTRRRRVGTWSPAPRRRGRRGAAIPRRSSRSCEWTSSWRSSRRCGACSATGARSSHRATPSARGPSSGACSRSSGSPIAAARCRTRRSTTTGISSGPSSERWERMDGSPRRRSAGRTRL